MHKETPDQSLASLERTVAGSAPAYSSDDELTALLQSLPDEGAGLGFEERVLRRVRAQPTSPMTFAKGFRLAAPLVVAGLLGFVFGPGLLDRSTGESSGAGPQNAGQVASVQMNGGQMNGGDENAPVQRPAVDSAIPSVANNAQVVGMPGYGSPGRIPSSRLQANPGLSSNLAQIRAEASRVRRQLEELRRTRSAASPTVSMILENGVVVEVDLRDLLAALEQRAAEFRTFEARGESEGRESPNAEEGLGGPPLW